jgi:hypothetical protein
MFAANGKALIYGGDSAYPPEPPLRVAIVLYYLPGSYRFRVGATAAGAEAFHAVAPKSVKKNILRISPEPIL